MFLYCHGRKAYLGNVKRSHGWVDAIPTARTFAATSYYVDAKCLLRVITKEIPKHADFQVVWESGFICVFDFRVPGLGLRMKRLWVL